MAQLDEDLEAGAHATIDDSPSSNEDTPNDGRDITTEKPKNDKTWNWDDDPNNPYNWSSRHKIQQVFMIAAAAFTTLALSTPQDEETTDKFPVPLAYRY